MHSFIARRCYGLKLILTWIHLCTSSFRGANFHRPQGRKAVKRPLCSIISSTKQHLTNNLSFSFWCNSFSFALFQYIPKLYCGSSGRSYFLLSCRTCVHFRHRSKGRDSRASMTTSHSGREPRSNRQGTDQSESSGADIVLPVGPL